MYLPFSRHCLTCQTAGVTVNPKNHGFSSLPWPSSRVPKDSSIHKGSIRQRQKCLEAQKQKDQEISNLKLSPCVKTEGKDAKSQVK